MNTYTRMIKSLSLLSALVLGASMPALVHADDTEIYTGGTATTTPPNVVFIIDTSGSMGSSYGGLISLAEKGAYDPAVTYVGYCDSNKVYWGNGTDAPPDCRTNSRYDLDKASFTCGSAASSFASTGMFTDKYARLSGTWRTLDSTDQTSQVDCETDADQTIIWSTTGTSATFYDANYVNWYWRDRLNIVMEVFRDLMDSLVANNTTMNLALMQFNHENGGHFVMPMTALDATSKTAFKNAVYALRPDLWTPLSETLYEAYLFYNGKAVDWGSSLNVSGVDDGSGNYVSPVNFQCQKNFVILLSDGDASSNDTDSDSDIKGLSNFSAYTGSSSCSGNCLDELADYMNAADCSTTKLGTQNIITHTVGFKTDPQLLKDAAAKGGGSYSSASTASSLTTSLSDIFSDVLAINSTFTAPAVSVNAYKRSYHNEELYFAVFIPDENSKPLWPGNIKRYKSSGADILDQNDDPAVDPNTGFTYATSRSYWSTVDDGAVVALGGAASMLPDPPTSRNTYTYIGTTSITSPVNLSSHPLSESNTNITATVLGDGTLNTTEVSDRLKWARGVDINDVDGDGNKTEARRQMGDPLHARPVLITYSGTELAPDITLFAATNEGYLHAIDTDDGTELFAFMPQELLPNIDLNFVNSPATVPDHPYGLDGPLTYWHNDDDGDGLVYDAGSATVDTGEHVYLYQGMRRGGRTYYSLDVTDRANPKLRWQINGGTGSFTELGQTWSAMKHAKIKVNNIDKEVLIFGGGYDITQDGNSTATNDTVGRAIYIVDATTGSKIWQAGPVGSSANLQLTKMTNSIPADITIMDINSDGYTDRMYVGDMRGQIWRFDIDNDGNTGSSNLVTGDVIAELGGATTADNRRFYYAPDVSFSLDSTHLYLAIGSGYRSHPTDKVIHDAFFVIRDRYVDTLPVDGSGNVYYNYVDSNNNNLADSSDAKISMSNLYDATSQILGNTSSTPSDISTARAALNAAEGWYFWLNEPSDSSFVGEKVTAESTSLMGTVFFSTFTPIQTVSSTCAPSQGRGLLYHVNLLDGSAATNSDGSQTDGTDTYTRGDRVATQILGGGLPPRPTGIYQEDGTISMFTGMTGTGTNFTMTPYKVRWRDGP